MVPGIAHFPGGRITNFYGIPWYSVAGGDLCPFLDKLSEMRICSGGISVTETEDQMVMRRRRSRSRSRKRNGGSSGWAKPSRLVIGIVVVSAVFAIFVTGALSSVQSVRSMDVNAENDPNALLGLDIAESVHRGRQSTLVSVTNRFPARSMGVTITLQDPNNGTLDPDGQASSSVSYTVGAGDTVSVEIDVDGNPDTISFDVQAQAGGVTIEAPGRQTDVTGGQPGGGGGGPPG